MITTLAPFSGASRAAVRPAIRRGLALAATAGLLVAASQLPAAAAPGQTSEDTTVANVEVGSTISLSGLTPSFTLTGLAGDLITGLDAVSYTVTTNNVAGYSVTVQAESPTLDPAGASTDTIPIENLRVRADDSGAYTALSDTAAVTLRTQATRSAQGGDDYSDDYQVQIPFVASDTYSATLDYVATTL